MSIHTSGEAGASAPRGDASIPELVKRLVSELATLVGQELTLAKLEIAAKLKHAATAGKMFAVAAVMGVAMVATLTATLIAALSLVVQVWAAALIVTAVYGLIAGICALIGIRAIKALSRPLERTIGSVKEDASAITAAIARGR